MAGYDSRSREARGALEPGHPTMRRRATSRIGGTLVALLVAATSLNAYTIVLRDGSTIQAQDEYRVRGERALITLQNGTETFLGLSEIDVEETEAVNREGYEGAVVLEEPARETEVVAQPEIPPDMTDAASGARAMSAAGREGEDEGAPDRPRVTAAGNLDFASLPRTPFPDSRVVRLLDRHFRGQRLTAVDVLRGSRDDRVLLAVTVGSEGEVFRAIALAATGLDALADAEHEEIAAIELLMRTADGGDAGQFLLTPELVQPLIDGTTEISDFYVRNVRL